VSAGDVHTVAIKAGGVLWAWGANQYGQLGDGTTIARSSPIEIMDDVISISAGGDHTLALKSDSSLWAWGLNMFGQLGDGTGGSFSWDDFSLTPTRIMDDVSVISAGGDFSMAIKTDDSLWAWGDNRYGELGDGITINHNVPVKIM